MGEHYKNIAVAVAGIDEEYQNNIIKGINSFAREHGINVAYFGAFGGVLQSSRYDVGEYNIYNLVNFSRFDGVILMTNTICSTEMRDRIYDRVIEAGVPAVILDCSDRPEFFNISIDNSSAMKQIVDHVITKHNAKVINYISGPLSNSEAAARYHAFVEVMMEHDINVDRERIYFGEFRSVDGRRAVEAFIDSGLSMPDAVICANDAMALTAMSELERYGYRVPDDIIVTGFDNTFNARHHSPSLTTVERPLFEVGLKACDIINRLTDGEDPGKEIKLEAKPVFSRSCGCGSDEDSDIQTYKRSTYSRIEGFQSEISMLNRLTSSLAETDSVEEVVRVFAQHIAEINCEKAYICLCEGWQGSFNESDKDFLVRGYTKKMSVPLYYSSDGIGMGNNFLSEQMFPEELEAGGNICYFLPLHFRERCLGYFVMVNSEFPIDSILCHSIIMNMSNSLEHIRQLIHLNKAIKELERLYVMDPLCNIYNRSGFTRATSGMITKCVKEHKKLMITFVDMDGLKSINDSFGHKEGDYALQRMAKIIKEVCGSEYVCSRFGGDEFVILGSDRTPEQAAEFEKLFEERLEEENRLSKTPYEISASIGTHLTYVDDNTKLFQLITLADSMMYEQKKKKKMLKHVRKDN